MMTKRLWPTLLLTMTLGGCGDESGLMPLCPEDAAEVDGACVALCDDSSTCAPERTCVAGLCLLPDELPVRCPDGQSLDEDGVCVVVCDDDAQCPIGDVCDHVRERCVSDPIRDAVAPSAYANPPSGPVSASMPIVIVFSEPMDTLSLELSGALLSSDTKQTWSSSGGSSGDNDTLTLTPGRAGWQLPAPLRVQGRDLAGNTMAALDLYYASITGPETSEWPPIEVPVHAVQVANSDGSFPCPITPEQVALWVAEANRVYADAGIQFTFVADAAGPDWQTLDSDAVNTITGAWDPTWNEAVATANGVATANPGKMAVMFRYGPNPGGATGGGFSWTNYAFIAMPGFDVTWVCGHQNITLFAHEIGHYLGLDHSFASIFPTVSAAARAVDSAGGDPRFFDGDLLEDTPPDPYIEALQCDPSIHTAEISGFTHILGRHDIMSYYDAVEKTLSPSQALTARQGALIRTQQSLARLLPGDILPPIEGESVSVTVSAGNTYSQTNMRDFLGNWSGDAHQFWSAQATGDTMTLTLPVSEPGRYRVWVSLTHAPDFGIFEASVNGQPIETLLDLYARRVLQTPPHALGTFALGPTSAELTFTAVGAHPDAIGSKHALGLDFILLERVDE